MKLSYGFALASIGAIAAAGVFGFGGCSSSPTGGSTGTGSSGAAPLPVVPTTGSAGTGGWHNFAVNNLFLGDTANGDTTFTPTTDGWKGIGFDLDGVNTTSSSSTSVCKPSTGFPVVVDGTGGIDNAFGEKITPILNTILTGPSKQISETYIQADGDFTVMINVDGITPQVATQTATGLQAAIFAGGAFDGGTLPVLTKMSPSLTTNWPVEPALLVGTAPFTPPLTSQVVMTSAGITNGNFVAVGTAPISLSLAVSGVNLVLNINNPIITFTLNADGHAGNGIIAGIIPVTQLQTALSTAVSSGAFGSSATICQEMPTLMSTIEKAADIMTSAPYAGAGETCDGLSIGLGFTAVEIAQPTNVAAGTLSTDGGGGCGDAG